MPPNTTTLLMVVLALGVFAVVVMTAFHEDIGPGLVSVSELFERHVTLCQADHPDWDQATCERIVRGEVWEGMTTPMLIASLGEPDEVDPSQIEPTHETWIYRTSTYGEEFFYIQGGTLDSWEPAPGCETCVPKKIRN